MPIPFLLIQLLESIIPPIVQIVVKHYENKEQTPEVQAKLQAHQAALDALKPADPSSQTK